MREKNKHGLSRYIPAHIREKVRQRDGFGCVHCGNPFYQYDHLSPEFSEATSHEVDGIILLCGGCHDAKGITLSLETIRASAANPKCRQTGFIFEAMDIGRSPLVVRVGSSTFEEVGVLIRCQGENVLSVKLPAEPGGPYRLSARFQDPEGKSTIEIVDNEWKAGIETWDIKRQGQHIEVRTAKGQIALDLQLDPPHGIVVHRLNMLCLNTRISVEPNQSFRVRLNEDIFEMDDALCKGAPIGIDIRTRTMDVGSGLGVKPGFAGGTGQRIANIKIGRMQIKKARPIDGPSLQPPESHTPPRLAIRWMPQIASDLGSQLKLVFTIKNLTDARTKINYINAIVYPFDYHAFEALNWPTYADELAADLKGQLDHYGENPDPVVIDDFDHMQVAISASVKQASADQLGSSVVYVVLIGFSYQNCVSTQRYSNFFAYSLFHSEGRCLNILDVVDQRIPQGVLALQRLNHHELSESLPASVLHRRTGRSASPKSSGRL